MNHLRKCLREILARMTVEHPNSDLNGQLQDCLDQVEQILIKDIRDGSSLIDEIAASDE